MAPSRITARCSAVITSRDPVAVMNSSPSGRGGGHRQHPVALHHRVQRPDRVHLGHDHLGAEAAGPLGDAAAAPAEPGDHHGAASQQHVGGPQDAVHGGLAGAVHALQHQPGPGGVRGHRGKRQRALGGHPAQPDHAGRGRLDAPGDLAEQVGPLLVQGLHQVAAVVGDQVRPGVQGLLDVPGVGRPGRRRPGRRPRPPRSPAAPPRCRPGWTAGSTRPGTPRRRPPAAPRPGPRSPP